ncbi:MAG: DNA polymerase I [Pseudomonadota bacterium]
MTKKLYLIDGSGFIFRAYHSMPPLSRKDGTPTGAVYGFINMMLKIIEAAQADYLAVIFDAGRQTFRNRIYPAYKANRPPAPDDLIPQFPLVRDATIALNLPAIELSDYEADDIIATYTKIARENNLEVVIVSSDKDLMQLIGENVSMYDGMKQKTIGSEQVQEKFGVAPNRVRDVLALIGDASDNVPGVPSIGPKTAAELINNFGDFATLLTRLPEIKQQKRREAIENNIEQAKLSYELIGLCYDVPDLLPLEELKLRTPDAEKLLKFLQEMEFHSLVARTESKHNVKAEKTAEIAKQRNYELVSNATRLKEWVDKAYSSGFVAFDTETTSLNAMQAEIVGFSLCIEEGVACYVPINHINGAPKVSQQASLFEPEIKIEKLAGQIEQKIAFEIIKPLLEDKSVLKIGHNIKYDMLVLEKYGIKINAIEDTMLISYLLSAGLNNQNMDELAEKYLGIKTISYDEITGTGKARIGFEQVTLEKALNYAAEDADITLQLWQKLKKQLISEHLITLYETIERPLIPVIVAMEKEGIKIEKNALALLSTHFEARIKLFEAEIYKIVGREFNVGSPKQLGEILFEEMNLPGGKKGKNGAYSTGAEVLDDLLETGNPLPQLIIDWRQLSKLKNTYTETLSEQINPKTGRVHTSYAMAVTTTGRLSSSDPNLQNIPIRTEEGRKIRHAFVANGGNKLISCDYSQIELRLLAHIADIEILKSAFRSGDDIHAITASQMFGVPVKEVSNDLRRKAKTINFGIIYGISGHGLAARLGIGRSEAIKYIETYFQQYPGIKEYMEATRKFARENGYVATLFGRKCHLSGINDKNAATRNFYERAAINAPLQGTAADIIKRAMILVSDTLRNENAKMLLQVHDELVIEAKTEEAERIAEKVAKAMESAVHLSIPLTVSRSIGDNWNEAH